MLTNVNSQTTQQTHGAQKLISWKYSYNRLNEEHQIANKKKNALDNLYQTGRISQSTRDSFNNEINQAITEIEKQQKDLLQKMEQKVTELQNQIKTLEMLLANYEIQHVVGEITEDTYQHEITLLGNGLETAKHELDIIKEAATQLCSPVQVPATAPISEVAPPASTPEPSPPVETAPLPEPEAAPTPQPENIQITPPEPEIIPTICAPEPAAEQTPTETPIETPAEIVIENAATVENPPETEAKIEAPVETPTETIPEIIAPIEEQPEAAIETPAEMPVTETPSEQAVENTEAQVENVEAVEPLQPETTPIEVIPQEIIQPIEEAIQAHPMEAPKEAHPEIIADPVTDQAQNAEESQPVTEASPEENSEKQDS